VSSKKTYGVKVDTLVLDTSVRGSRVSDPAEVTVTVHKNYCETRLNDGPPPIRAHPEADNAARGRNSRFTAAFDSPR
jgi:hypothetical protein